MRSFEWWWWNCLHLLKQWVKLPTSSNSSFQIIGIRDSQPTIYRKWEALPTQNTWCGDCISEPDDNSFTTPTLQKGSSPKSLINCWFFSREICYYNWLLQVLSSVLEFFFFSHLNRGHSYLNFYRSTKIRSALKSRMQRCILDSFPMKILSYGLRSCLCHQR